MTLSDISVGKVDDDTLRWDSTMLIVCEIHAANQTGLGYTYGNKAAASVAGS
jgi:hypothetical protein